MEETTDAQDTGSAQEMGIAMRMVGVLFSPGEIFASVNERIAHKDWFIPLIIMAVVGILAARLVTPIAMIEGMQQMRERIEQSEQLSEEQREKALEKMEATPKFGAIFGMIGAPISTAAILFVEALIFLVLANFIFGGRGTYKKFLAVTSYSFLTGIPGAIVTVPLMLVKGTVKVQVGLGLLVSESMEGSFLFNLISQINLFTFWQLCLVTIGLGAVAGLQTRRVAYGVFGLWAIYILVVAAAKMLLGGLVPGMGR